MSVEKRITFAARRRGRATAFQVAVPGWRKYLAGTCFYWVSMARGSLAEDMRQPIPDRRWDTIPDRQCGGCMTGATCLFCCLSRGEPPNIPRPVRPVFELGPVGTGFHTARILSFCLRCHVGRDYDPIKGQWFEDLEENEIFLVLSVDPDAELVEIQYENGDIEEIDLDTWHELDLERTTEPEGWASDNETAADKAEEDDDEDEDDDWDEDDDEDDDDWDDDDEDLDDDYSDRDGG